MIAALELTDVSRSFGAVRAVEDVTLHVRTGTVHALLGENGAGKTTLMRIAYGLVAPDTGSVRLFGASRKGGSVRDAVRAGVGMVQQHLSLAPSLTASENFLLGGSGWYRPAIAGTQLAEAVRSSGLSVPADSPAGRLGLVERQRLEILKALRRGARLLILDEPTTGLAPTEIEDLLNWLRQFVSTGGTVVLVTHKLREALAVADEITVLRRGRVVHQGSARTATTAEVARTIFPEAPGDETPFARTTRPRGDVVVVIEGADLPGAATMTSQRAASRPARAIQGATLRVHRHEIVGVAGVEGSGHRELLYAAAGLAAPLAGTVWLGGRSAFIPADRVREAIIPDFTLVENVALEGAGQRRGKLGWTDLARRTRALIEQFQVVTPSLEARAGALSGGNQQRLVVARVLEHQADLVVADDPTRGLDIRSAGFVLAQLRRAAAAGAGVLLYSSDLDELLAVADRVLVCFHGTVREVPAEREAVGRAMVGATDAG